MSALVCDFPSAVRINGELDDDGLARLAAGAEQALGERMAAAEGVPDPRAARSSGTVIRPEEPPSEPTVAERLGLRRRESGSPVPTVTKATKIRVILLPANPDREPDSGHGAALELERTPWLKGGPDMSVAGRKPGAPGPGFDWIEIKPNTECGIETFVGDERGKSTVQSGRMRLVVYDPDGTLDLDDYEILQ